MIEIRDGGLFVLNTLNTTYAFKTLPSGHLEHLYYGRKIHIDSDSGLAEQREFAPGNSSVYDEDNTSLSLEDVRLEASFQGKGDIRESFLEVINSDGSRTSDFVYSGYSLREGKPETDSDLPMSYGDKASVLEVELKDKENNLTLMLIYTLFEECDVITRSCVLTNNGEDIVEINKIMSLQLDFDPGEYSFTTFSGAWAREMNKTVEKLGKSKLVNYSSTGASSNHRNPFVMLGRGAFDEDFGEVYGFNLIYSGNHYTSVERSSYGKVRLLSGINPEGFSWKLEKGESFTSPEAVMTYSSLGCNTMSASMHSFVGGHVVRGAWKDSLRPVLLNSWEAAYFKINEGKLLKLARKAKSVGIELFVMDDGWFKGRNDDTTSLGDWIYDKDKLPHGVKGLAEKINKLGLKFGIWVEPEMISENSDLYKAHPDYAMRLPGKKHSTGRNQMILDLTRTEVQDYVIDAMSSLFYSAPISYVKWDYNRNFTDVFSLSLPKDRQGEVSHRYMLGLYRVMRILTRKFPDVLFEGCASGGNRFDLGILSYFPQIWASDDTDAYCRGIIQNGYSYGYPQSVYTCHVSDVPNHQTLRRTPLDTRFNVAAFGVCGYECNLNDLKREELNKIKSQIEFYKENRKLFQFGKFFRKSSFDDGNILSWTIAAEDGSEAVSLLMQSFAVPNTHLDILYPRGLKGDALYHIENRKVDFDLRGFGGLVNYVAPIHVKQDGILHAILAKFVKMPSEKEDITMYGDAAMYAGVHLKPKFAAGGYNENMRYFPDFASRVYTIKSSGKSE